MATPPPDHNGGPSADTLAALWRTAVARHADRPLLHVAGDGSCFRYAEADEIVSLVAARLAAGGVRRGDRVCIVAPFHPEAAFVVWGAMLTGAVIAPLDCRLSADELDGLCRRIGPALVFCDRERGGALAGTGVPLVFFDDDRDDLYPGVCFADWLQDGKDAAPLPDGPQPDDPAVILFTSGTSSDARGVVLSHGALCRSGRLMADSYGWRCDDVLLNLGELHTMSGLRNPCVAALHAGAAFVAADAVDRANALRVARLVRDHRATLLGCVPAMLGQFNRFGERIGTDRLETLRQVICTGSSLTDAVVAGFEARFGVPVMNYYGLTETAGLCTGVVPRRDGSRPAGIGIPLGCRIRIVDRAGEPVGAGEPGELLVRSDRLMTGYWREPRLTERVLADGWFRTGDLVRQEPDGSLLLVGRLADSFKDRRGEFVHPGAVEEVLELHPHVAEAGVCGYAAPDGGTFMAAFIVAAPDAPRGDLAGELRRFVAERLGPHRTPDRIERIDLLPRGTNDKLLRRILQERCR